MAVNEKTSLAPGMGVTEEMMACPVPRVPFVPPGDIPADIREELAPSYQWAFEMWGTVPRYFQMLGHAPVLVEAWMLLDQKLRTNRLKTDPDYIRIMELVIVKTALLTQCNN